MEKIVERLRASKAEYEREASQRGYDAGKFWAEDVASYAELQRLASKADGLKIAMKVTDESAYSLDEQFVFVVAPETDGNRDEAADFWSACTSEDDGNDVDVRNELIYLNQFIAGAMDVWGQVKEEVAK